MAGSSDAGLAVLGLHCGEVVRWHPSGATRWRSARVVRREADGSVGVVDDRGATRSIGVERVQVRRPGPRGGAGWEPLATRAGRSEQLRLELL